MALEFPVGYYLPGGKLDTVSGSGMDESKIESELDLLARGHMMERIVGASYEACLAVEQFIRENE